MKRVLSLMLVAVLAMTSTVFAQSGVDTIVNKGDGKVVILDQRPKTVINRPNTTKAVEPPVFITVESPATQPVVNNYYPIRSEDKYSLENWLAALLCVGLLAWFVIYLLQRGDKCGCDCSCHKNTPQPPVVNHFHVSGGQAIVDGSETWSNFQPSTHHHNHHHMPKFMAAFMPKEQNDKPASDTKDQKFDAGEYKQPHH